MNKKQYLMIVAAVFVLGAFGLYWQATPASIETDSAAPESVEVSAELSNKELMKKFEKAMSIIQEQYVEEISEQELVEGAIEGMLRTLEDPYSVYMDQETATQFVESLGSHFEGIGAEVSMTDGKVTIVAPFRESPAEKAGLQPNDKILKIDGDSIDGLSLYEAVLQIRGEKGTIVNLTIERPGVNELFDIPVERGLIPIETVRSDVIERDGTKVGLLEITSFSEDTAARFKEKLEDLESQGIEGLLIDVRGNPGGYLNAVEDIGKLIIPGGTPIVQIENRDGEKVRYMSNLDQKKPYPIIGITDKASASASEILSAALSEGGGYDVVGEQTFGKGTVQQTIKLGDGSELKLSLFKWLTSAGNDIHGEGVMPTIEVKQPDYFYVAPLSIGDEGNLRIDMMSERIKNAQMMLKGLGFEPGRTDGYFNEQTEQAVIAFQRAHSLDATGEINEETAALIQQELVEHVRDKENDHQLQTAIELIIKQAKE
ncbi:S41 family peptidase [Halalkalibacter akibai]|uniref:Carboxyl-terminal protease n=1 Tax=Halalkalibacter akibai (strain ATCC 43226 / DSM 21942 / CIP 109018 / JCM 9157 / 1139) TaxID=1236973 RepID=W4QLV7_HALA3|nr:S41 family peptidase [Halalkalibacter akibai]GAE33066.1 carboxyl-terminal protease [Halalkalibacter akibai JCM 9157]